MNKRKLHHLWIKSRWIKPWYFLALSILSIIICIFALRANNQHMIELRQAVYDADQANDDVQAPLKALQSYVTTHMNTNLNAGANAVYPPIQLKYTYERLVQSQKDAFAKANSTLYSDAQNHCEQLNSTDVSGRNRVPCIQDYVQSHSTQKIPTIPDALYKFSFVSPRWSPDLAGWSLVVAILSGGLFIITFASSWWLKRAVK